MLHDLAILRGNYLRDILEQPQALEQTLDALKPSKQLLDLAERLRKREFDAVVLTGMGSSFHALHPMCIQLIEAGIPAMMIETSELVHYKKQLLRPSSLLVAVSQSGESAEVVRMLDTNQGLALLIGVTNTPGSSLAKRATAAVCMDAGQEFSVSCKTYLASLLTLQWLVDILVGRPSASPKTQLASAAPAVRAYLAAWEDHVRGFSRLLEGVRHLFLVGRGPSLAAVGTGALIVKESDRFHAEGMSSAAFRHGPLEMLNPEMFVLILAGDERTRDLNQRLLDDIASQGGRAAMISELAEGAECRLASSAPAILPVLEMLPIQMITLSLAAAAGREPGRFEFASKVTTVE